MSPLATVGIPVFNEARFLETSLRSILEQDYPNLEIIVSDNASTDTTFSLCTALLSHRTNTVLHRFETNQGATENFRFVAENAQGKYFMWASGHDIWSPDLISSCVELMERDPGIVVAFGTSAWIDEDGNPLPKYSGWIDTRGMQPTARLMTTVWGNMHPILGLIRKSALDRARPLEPVVGADLILLAQLALQGDFAHVTSTSWCRREFRHEESHDQKVKRYRSSEYGLTKGSMIDRTFPLLRLPLGLAQSIIDADTLRFTEKLAVLAALFTMLPARYLDGKRK
ncbi:MAG TPA: glycosyltransferase family A protein [Azoarcus taiwanensis]|nr:glycosyltransferase family A protein [Azoarcus taiwanensis]